MYLLSNIIYMIMILILMLISVAFLTLFERKLLSYIQYRKGPNKIGLMGILQPFSDAIKLFSKENLILMKINRFMYFLSPMFGFLFSMMMWMFLIPCLNEFLFMEFSILLMMSIMMISAYTIMFSGWASNSNYSMLGAMRGLSQTISYEISFSLILLSIIMMIENFEIMKFNLFQNNINFIFILLPLFLMFYISMIAELNRSPFDLTESESELVSGFNTEYMSGSFALIFLSEYSFIIFYNYLMIIMFFGFMNMKLYIMLIIFNLLIIMIRSIVPRIRYDQLMYFCWLKLLPMSLIYIMIIMSMKILFI